MNINFKLLQTFVAVAETGSFRRAAEATNRTTSAVSMQVRQLEDQVGTPLFHRTSRQVELTVEGRQLLERARRAMGELALGLQELEDAVRVRHGVVRIASSPTIAAMLLPGVLAAFGRDHPDVTVRVRELGAQDTLDAVRQREVDFGIGPSPSAGSDFDVEPLVRDAFCALVPVGHPLAARSHVPIGALDGVPTVMLGHFSAMRCAVEEAARAERVRLNVQFEVQQMQTLIAMVCAGLGVGVATRIAIGPTERLGALRVLGLGSPPLQRQIDVITARGLALTPLAAELARRLQQGSGN